NAAGYPTLYNNINGAGLELDNISVYDWIETRVPGGHSSPMGELLDVAYNIEYGADTVVQSSLNLIYLLGYQPIPGDFRIVGRSDKRYHLAGGNEGLPRAIAEWLAPGTIVGFAVQRGVVDGVALCRMFNRAMHSQTLPKYLSSDHDPLYRFY